MFDVCWVMPFGPFRPFRPSLRRLSLDSSDSAFATTSIDYALIAATLLLLLPPTTQHSIDIADSSDIAFAAKNIYM